MRTIVEFNEKYIAYLEEGYSGMQIEFPSIVHYLDEVFTDLIKIPGFTYSTGSPDLLRLPVSHLPDKLAMNSIIPVRKRQVSLLIAVRFSLAFIFLVFCRVLPGKGVSFSQPVHQ